jgi:hypothetical protein
MNSGVRWAVHVRAAPAFCRDSNNEGNGRVLAYVGPRADEEYAGDALFSVATLKCARLLTQTALKCLHERLTRTYLQ